MSHFYLRISPDLVSIISINNRTKFHRRKCVMGQDEDILAFLKMKNYDDLFRDIPEDIRSDIEEIGSGKSELEVIKEAERIGKLNNSDMDIFLGLGAYDRYIPASVNNIIMRNEFITSYTPYQAEISQGMLQSLFEYQSIISDLTEMDITNSSMYDGPTALGEALRMAHRINGKSKVLLPSNVRKSHLQVLQTYMTGLTISIHFYSVNEDGTIDLDALTSLIDDDVTAIVTYNPSNFGTLDPGVGKISEIKRTALHVAYFDAISLALIKPPGAYGADIAVGEGQQMGVPLYYGGPYLGLFSFKSEYVRKSPGRLIGKTTDVNGDTAFVMTLQTREQHIRRDRATSNICTNQALLAIASTAYLSILGKNGLKWVASKTMSNVKEILDKMNKIGYMTQYKWKNPFFSDFMIDAGDKSGLLFSYLEQHNILGGIQATRVLNAVERDKNNSVFFATTEMNDPEQMDNLVNILEGLQ